MGYLPWRSDNYVKGAFFGLRTLIVGESHYCNDDPLTTRTVVREAIDGEDTRFFLAVGSACVGRETYKADRARSWHSVAFVNFVQQSVPTATHRPTQKMFRDERFRAVQAHRQSPVA